MSGTFNQSLFRRESIDSEVGKTVASIDGTYRISSAADHLITMDEQTGNDNQAYVSDDDQIESDDDEEDETAPSHKQAADRLQDMSLEPNANKQTQLKSVLKSNQGQKTMSNGPASLPTQPRSSEQFAMTSDDVHRYSAPGSVNMDAEEDDGNKTNLEYTFRITDAEKQPNVIEECFKNGKVCIKVLFAIALFSVILGCVVVSKGSILFIAAQMNRYVGFKRTGFVNETHFYTEQYTTTEQPMLTEEENSSISEPHISCDDGPNGECEQCGVPVCLQEQDPLCLEKESVRWIWSMFICQCTPYFIMFLRCLWKISFKKKKTPTKLVFFGVFFVETLSTVGIYLLLYVQLPKLDATRGLFLCTGLGLVPSFLKIFNKPDHESNSLPAKILWTLFDCIVFLFQILPIVAWVWYISAYPIEFGSSINSTRTMDEVCEPHVWHPPSTPETTMLPTTDAGTTKSTTGANGTNIVYNINIGIIVNVHVEENDDVSTAAPTTTEPPLPPIFYAFRQIGFLPENIEDVMYAPIIVLLVSLGFWENFIDQASVFFKILQPFRKATRKSRTKIYLFIGPYKIILTFVLLMIHYFWVTPFSENILFENDMLYDNKCEVRDIPVDDKDYKGDFQSDWLIVAGIQISVGILCYYASDLAIKGRMQIIGFTLPLFLATPVCFFLLYWACASCGDVWDFGTSYYWNCFAGHDNYVDYMDTRYAWVGFMLWLAFMGLTRYLWTPTIERLAKLDRIFTYPMPEGPILEQSLMLSRRRNDDEVLQKKTEHHGDKGDEHSATDQINHLKPGYVGLMEDPKPNTPFIYMCATMWHENEKEMLQIMKSIFRVNADQCAKQAAKDYLTVTSADYYRFEAHIFFDDAFEPHAADETKGFKVNTYVKDFIRSINLAASCIMNRAFEMDVPNKYHTPYGGRLEWTLPIMENKLILHLKDKQLIRNRKRWSQIMYLHRFLGLGISAQPVNKATQKLVSENTFILALDGDIDFKPDAVLSLVDLMKRNPGVAAACGRIHPIGTGPMVWYQKFEYSISHWLQKATEHVLGCVLCSPGCFSLFRCSALMDDNVVQKYTILPTEPVHHIQYDQGEDRWLCTLLLQQGYRVEYSAAADAYTYAPEEFNEFYNQRRRWITSTFANILDLLKTGRATAQKNENISLLYILYQCLLFAASVLGPGTIFMLVVGAFEAAFDINPLVSFVLGLAPLIVFMILCFKASQETQLYYAALLSVVFAVLQMLVIVGISQQMLDDGICSPSSIFFLFVLGSFVLSAVLHPQEAFNLFHGFLYYLFIPSMYLILIIYSLCNLHVISWGTRENKPTQTEKEKEELAEKKKQVEDLSNKSWLEKMLMLKGSKISGSSSSGWSINCLPCCLLRCCSHDEGGASNVKETLEIAKTISDFDKETSQSRPQSVVFDEHDEDEYNNSNDRTSLLRNQRGNNHVLGNIEDGITMETQEKTWMEDEDIPSSKDSEKELEEGEKQFWENLIEAYLRPLELTQEEKDKTTQGLLDLRNKAVFSFFLIDLLLMVLILGFTQSGVAIAWTCTAGGKTYESELDPIGFAFVFIFGSVLFIQVIGMLIHRMFTFLQIISATVICKNKNVSDEDFDEKGNKPNQIDRQHFSDEQVLNLVQQMQRFDTYDVTSNNPEDNVDASSDTSSDYGDYDEDPYAVLVVDPDDEFDKEDHKSAVSKNKPDHVLNNAEVKKKLAARYMALSNEVIGRRPSEPALVIGPDDIRPSISGGAGPRPSIYGRPSVHLQVLQKIESSTKDKSPTKRKVSFQLDNAKIKQMADKADIKEADIDEEGAVLEHLLFDENGKPKKKVSNWNTRTVYAPDRRPSGLDKPRGSQTRQRHSVGGPRSSVS